MLKCVKWWELNHKWYMSRELGKIPAIYFHHLIHNRWWFLVLDNTCLIKSYLWIYIVNFREGTLRKPYQCILDAKSCYGSGKAHVITTLQNSLNIPDTKLSKFFPRSVRLSIKSTKRLPQKNDSLEAGVNQVEFFEISATGFTIVSLPGSGWGTREPVWLEVPKQMYNLSSRVLI